MIRLLLIMAVGNCSVSVVRFVLRIQKAHARCSMHNIVQNGKIPAEALKKVPVREGDRGHKKQEVTEETLVPFLFGDV